MQLKHLVISCQNFDFLYIILKGKELMEENIQENQDTFEKWDVWKWTDDMSKFAKSTPHTYDIRDIEEGHWSLDPHHKMDSLLYIVTETFYNNYQLNNRYREVSEKTWKPIAMKMPFITIGQPHTLRLLRELGYKTFPWDESYDEIIDPKERMSAIVDLVISLNNRTDFRDMIDSCREIVEHNFNLLKMRRPEMGMIRTILNEFY